jgi:hypothetical protein
MQWSGGAPYVHEYDRPPVIGMKATAAKKPSGNVICKCKSGKHDCAAEEDNWYLQVIKADPIKTRGGNAATPTF